MSKSGAQPNILLVMVDQLTAAALREYGGTTAITPNISALAATGTTFSRFYCNYPLCSPSRASLLTGQFPSDIDAFDNASEFSACIPTLPHYLRMVGYATVLSGKMHFVGPDQLHGYEQRLTTDIYPAHFGWTPDWRKSPFTWYPTAHSGDTVLESGICARSIQLDYDEEVAFRANQFMFDYVRGTDERPFFLTVSFSHPHPPFYITEEFWRLYEGVEIEMPRHGVKPIDEVDTMTKGVQFAHGLDKKPVSDEFVRLGRRAYYAMVSYVDRKLGDLMQTLESCGLSENTVVVFTSDHGEMLGEKGMWYKRSFFEQSARVPFIIADPRIKQARVSTRLGSLIDLMPTILDLAGAPLPTSEGTQLRGKSLRATLQDGLPHADDYVICEYLGEGVAGPCRMVAKQNWKYIFTYGAPDLLFDLERDPDELHDISSERPEVRDELKQIVLRGWDPEQLRHRILHNQERRLTLVAGLAPTEWASWDFEVPSQDKNRFVRLVGAREMKMKLRWPRVEPLASSLRD